MRRRKVASVAFHARRVVVLLLVSFAVAGLSRRSAAIRGDEGQAGDPPPAATTFSLGEVVARPGDVVLLPLRVRSDTPLAMVSWSLEFDASALEFVEAELSPEMERLREQIPANDTRFDLYHDEEQGWLQASLVLDFQGRETFSLPAEVSLPVGLLRFKVRESTAAGAFPIVFTRLHAARYQGHFQNRSGFVYNVGRRSGRPFTEDDQFEDAPEAGLQDGAIRVGIIGDVGIFVRGDANMDNVVDVSDPVRILNTLFLGGEPLACEQAADANKDNRLDISDPVTLLSYLFLEPSAWSPSPEVVSSETDGLSCSP